MILDILEEVFPLVVAGILFVLAYGLGFSAIVTIVYYTLKFTGVL